MNSRISGLWSRLTRDLSWQKLLWILLGSMICSFGIHNIHQRTGITEGGIMGLMLLLEHWLHISPAYLTPVLDAACYVLAYKLLGGGFIKLSVLSTLCVSSCYKLWEHLPFLLPDLSHRPLLAAVLGGIFIGVGVGLVIRQGGSCGGDDALALAISKALGWRLSRAYLFTDITVLALSLTYIPLRRISFSLITVTISSNLVDWVQNWRRGAAEPLQR